MSITRQAATGGVIRDMNGNWIIGFTHYLGQCNPLEAKHWGIMDGVLILLQNGLKQATIQTDCLEVVKLLTGTVTNDLGISDMSPEERT